MVNASYCEDTEENSHPFVGQGVFEPSELIGYPNWAMLQTAAMLTSALLNPFNLKTNPLILSFSCAPAFHPPFSSHPCLAMITDVHRETLRYLRLFSLAVLAPPSFVIQPDLLPRRQTPTKRRSMRPLVI